MMRKNIFTYMLFLAPKNAYVKRADTYAFESINICSFFVCFKTLIRKCRLPP